MSGQLSQFYAGSGNDSLTVSGSNDFVQLGSGNADVSVTGANDGIQAGLGTASVQFGQSATLYDQSGKSILTGTGSFALASNNDSLTLTGDSNVSLGTAGTSIIFGRGSGNDVVNLDSATGKSQILYGTGVSASDLLTYQDGSDLVIKIADTNDVLRLHDQFITQNVSRFSLSTGAEQSATQTEQIAQPLPPAALSINSSDSDTTFDESAVNLNATINITGTNDVVIATPLDNTISATGGNESVSAGAGNDTITTGGGGNTIHASAGTATITPGSGNNTVFGGAGTATISVNSGDGILTINENTAPAVAGSTDAVAFGSGIASSDLSLSATNYDLTVNVGTTGTQVVLPDALDVNAVKPVTEFKFANGTSNAGSSTVEMIAEGTNAVINAGTGNESVYLYNDNLSFTGTSELL